MYAAPIWASKFCPRMLAGILKGLRRCVLCLEITYLCPPECHLSPAQGQQKRGEGRGEVGDRGRAGLAAVSGARSKKDGFKDNQMELNEK